MAACAWAGFDGEAARARDVDGPAPPAPRRRPSTARIRLTMNIYTHLNLADTARAVAALPRI